MTKVHHLWSKLKTLKLGGMLDTLEEFNFSFNLKIPAQQIRDLGTCQFIERKESVLRCGPVGVGKTHIAQALGHQDCRLGYKVLFTKRDHPAPS